MARPRSLTPEVSEILLTATGKGLPLSAAAELAGLSPDTVREWIRRGEGTDDRPEDEPFAAFAESIKRVRAAFMLATLERITAAGAESWQASAWALERLYPRDFAMRVRAEVDGELGGMLDRLAAGLDPDTYQRVLRLLAAEESKGPGAP